MPVLLRCFVLGMLTVLLSSCGFHLRGHTLLSAELNNIYVDSPEEAVDFKQKVKLALTNSGSTIVQKKTEANSILILGPVQDSKRLISINSLAQGRDYSFFKRVKFSLQNAAGDMLIDNRTVEVRRDVVNNPDDALGNDQQEQELKPELEQALIYSLLLQLRLQ